MFALQSFKQSISLVSSQHSPAWSASQVRMRVKPHDLASARCAWLSFKMSAAVLISMSHSSVLWYAIHQIRGSLEVKTWWGLFVAVWCIRCQCIYALLCARVLPWVWRVDIAKVLRQVVVVCWSDVPVLQCARGVGGRFQLTEPFLEFLDVFLQLC